MLDIPLPPSSLALSDPLAISLIGVALLLLGGGVTYALLRAMAHGTLTNARREAEMLRTTARGEGENLAKQLELDARNALAQRREAFEKELQIGRSELKEAERRLTGREDKLDRKLDVLTTKEKYLDGLDGDIKKREAVTATRERELDELIRVKLELIEEARRAQKLELLRIARMSEDDACQEAMARLERESSREADQIIARNMERAEESSRENALKITLQAIQRYASEHTAESTVNTVPIPSDDMKGRIIGREGRNIRAFEQATGADVIVDDTPGLVVISCFDPVRRATATEIMARLVEDGRIHPGRIEELAQTVNKEMDERVIKKGKEAVTEVNLHGLHPKIVEMMGRLHYRTSYGQNILRHSIETAFLCQTIAEELGLDGEIARRCGFLHDIGKAMDHEQEGTHPELGAAFAKKYGEKEAVLNAVAGHHNDIPSTTAYTPIVMAADAISGARPGARRDTLAKYQRRLEELEGIATSMKGVREAFAIQAGREVRVIVDPDQVADGDTHVLARDIAKRVSDEMTFPGEIKVTVLREMRTVEYAR